MTSPCPFAFNHSIPFCTAVKPRYFHPTSGLKGNLKEVCANQRPSTDKNGHGLTDK
jgi:hypothetical protein